MPIFEYRCEDCNYSFEAIVAEAFIKIRCEQCGEFTAVRQPKVYPAPHKWKDGEHPS